MWVDYLMNPEAIRSLWKEPSGLSVVELHTLKLERDGPRCSLFLESPSFPDAVPAKWKASGYNAVIIEVTAFGITDMSLQNWGTNNHVAVECMKCDAPPGIAVRLSGSGIDVSFVCDGLLMQHFHPYIKGD